MSGSPNKVSAPSPASPGQGGYLQVLGGGDFQHFHRAYVVGRVVVERVGDHDQMVYVAAALAGFGRGGGDLVGGDGGVGGGDPAAIRVCRPGAAQSASCVT